MALQKIYASLKNYKQHFDHTPVYSIQYLFSGRAPASQTLDYVRKLGFSVDNETELPINHGITVTVPGAAAAWCDTVEKFGSGKVKIYR